MKKQVDAGKAILIVALAIVALAVAIYSGMRSFGASQGRSVGDLGNLSGDRGSTATTSPGSSPVANTGGRDAETQGGDAASGAPPEAAQAAGSGGREGEGPQ